MGFFAIIRKIYTGLLSAAGAILAKLRPASKSASTRSNRSSSIARGLDSPPEIQNVPVYPAFSFEQAALPAELEARLAVVDWRQRDVLVGTLRSPAQLKACMDGRFYYIPAALIGEENMPIRCVALFQTPRIFPGHAGIFYFGRVLRCTLVQRGSIREVPQTHGKPDTPYYRFQIQQWLALPHPILPKEAGFVRAFTNSFLLENAEFIPELLLQSETEFRLFMELKRRIGAAPSENGISGFALRDIQVLITGGSIQVFQAGKRIGSCSVQDFSRYPVAAFHRLYSDV